MVVQTLRAMALGGMRDHIGGGFHRYSVDGNWRVPHFEKMLYDQAQLVLACLEAAQAGDDPFFAQIAEDTLQYVRRDMTDAAAASIRPKTPTACPPEPQDLRTSGPQDLSTLTKSKAPSTSGPPTKSRRCSATTAPIFEGRYGVLPNGNAPFDPQHEFVNKNLLLHGAVDRRHRQGSSSKTPIDVAESLLRARQILFDARERGRVRSSTTRC